MALSPNYGFPEPDNSSLVKNGAQDIRALGDAVDTAIWNVGYGQAGKNKIINGDFGIWQRGTSFTPAVGTGWTYLADRFRWLGNGTGGARTISRQSFTPASAPVAGYESSFFLRVDSTSATTGATDNLFSQPIEDVRTFAGNTVSISFWAKAASAITLPKVTLVQDFGGGGSGGVETTAVSSQAITTSWTRYTYSVAVPSISGKTIGTGSSLEFRIYLPINSTFTFDVWGVQVEYGSKATPFQTATGTIQGELAACQRYYYRQTAAGAYANFGLGIAYNTTQAYIYVIPPVTMRVLPTAIDYSSLSGQASPGSAISALTALTINNAASSPSQTTLTATVTAATFTNGSPAAIVAGNAPAGFVGLSAEL